MSRHSGRNQAIKQFAFLAVNRVEQALAVNSQADCLPHPDIPQNAGFGIEVEKKHLRRGADRRFNTGLFAQPLSLERTHGFDDINIARRNLHRPGIFITDRANVDGFEIAWF